MAWEIFSKPSNHQSFVLMFSFEIDYLGTAFSDKERKQSSSVTAIVVKLQNLCWRNHKFYH